jgi:hypothetical protein
MLSSPLALGVGFARAEALDMGLLIMSSSIICASLIYATAAGAHANAAKKANRAERSNLFTSLPPNLRLSLEVVR